MTARYREYTDNRSKPQVRDGLSELMTMNARVQRCLDLFDSLSERLEAVERHAMQLENRLGELERQHGWLKYHGHEGDGDA